MTHFVAAQDDDDELRTLLVSNTKLQLEKFVIPGAQVELYCDTTIRPVSSPLSEIPFLYNVKTHVFYCDCSLQTIVQYRTSTTVPDNSSNTYSKSCYSRPILHLGAMSIFVSFTSWPLYLRDHLNRIVCGFQ